MSKNRILPVVFCACILMLSFMTGYKYIQAVMGHTLINEDTSNASSKLEANMVSVFAKKDQFININGEIRKLLGQREMNDVIRLENGYMNQRTGWLTDEDIARYAKNTKEFSDILEARGIKYIWFTLPYVVDKDDPKTPVGIDGDYGNDNLDRVTEAFNDAGIATVDLRDKLHDAGYETYDLFYKTDHHWTTEGGFWAYNQLVDYIENIVDVNTVGTVDAKIRNLDDYEITVYPNWFLGSRGQRTGKDFGGMDDFDLILPKFDTYVETIPRAEDELIGGTVAEMMINQVPLSYHDYMGRGIFDSVMGGSIEHWWHNPNASSSLRVMVIGDSMMRAVFPYMAMSFSDVAYGCYCMDVSGVDDELISEFQPDIVISMNYVTNLNPEAFEWGLIK